MESSSRRLLDLPPEVLENIAFAIRPSLKSLGNFAQACRSLCLISTPALYKSVALWSLDGTSKFSWSISHSPNLIPLVREVQLHFHDLATRMGEAPEDAYRVLAKLGHLESLVIRTVWFLYDKAEKTSLINKPLEIFPALRSCNLSCDEEPGWYWYLDPYQAFLTHPGLQTLTLTGASIDKGLPTGGPPPRSTQLQELQLLNCNITPEGLRDMLHYSQSLKHFSLRGRPREVHEFEGARSGYIDALKAHATSLETLVLDLRLDGPQSIDLRDFKALKKLAIEPRVLIGADTTDTQHMRRASAASWRDVLPPNLEHLTFWCREHTFPVTEVYELVRNGDLPLTSFTCEIPRYLDYTFTPEPLAALRSVVLPSGRSLYEAFKKLGVDFVIMEIPVIEDVPSMEYPCECWRFTRY